MRDLVTSQKEGELPPPGASTSCTLRRRSPDRKSAPQGQPARSHSKDGPHGKSYAPCEYSASLCFLYERRGELDAIDTPRGTGFVMLVLAIRIVEGMFIVVALGCILVLVLTAIDDIRVLFSRDDDKH